MVSSVHLGQGDIPEIPATVRMADLDRETRSVLAGLGKEYGERVGLHLAAAAQLIDTDPELAYRHARTAADRAGRVAVARETAGIAAYVTGRYSEAARELKAFQRMSGTPDHLPIIADCERGLGRPERAIDLGKTPAAERLRGAEAIEMVIVVASARADLGDYAAAEAQLKKLERGITDPDVKARVAEARTRVAALSAGGDREAIDAPVPIPVEPDEQNDDIDLFDAEQGTW